MRYVAYQHGEPVAALQVVTLDDETAKIANVYTTPEHRREGIASALLARARQDFKTVEHADEVHLSPAGRAWRDKLGGAAKTRTSRPAPTYFVIMIDDTGRHTFGVGYSSPFAAASAVARIFDIDRAEFARTWNVFNTSGSTRFEIGTEEI